MIAVIGAGPLGGALAHVLARRNRIGEVRLIDPDGKVAEGKALDILQSAPIEPFATRVSAATTYAAAAGADAIVLADHAAGEIAGENGLALLRQIARLETTAPFVFAGGDQRELIDAGTDRASDSARATDWIRSARAGVRGDRRRGGAARREPDGSRRLALPGFRRMTW